MESIHLMLKTVCIAIGIPLLFLVCRLVLSCFILPVRAYGKLRRNGFTGPPPSFPLGNTSEMTSMKKDGNSNHTLITHDIHSNVSPYFSRWAKSYGKVFIYWLGTEPFIYIGDPEFLKQMSSGILGKNWGKPNVFKHDRTPMFGDGLVMVDGNDWVRHRHVITPAFTPSNLKGMANLMVESANNMLEKWRNHIDLGKNEIDVEKDIIITAAEIIGKASFGITDDIGERVFEKLRALQMTLFKSNRLVGVPFSRFLFLKQTLEARKLGKEIDELLLSIITSRMASSSNKEETTHQQNLLGILLTDGKLTTSELVDECKTFFFGGHETTALSLTWTLLLLALNPEWQTQLREEITEVVGEGPLDPTMLDRLQKMGWVMNEALRLYPPSPNAQRQARHDIKVSDDMTIPNGTNMWIDLVGMHHDPALWGDDVNEFKPERFKDDINGGCKHKMGYLPFGFGGRMCIGRNLTMMEYRIVLSLILTRFSVSAVSSNYICSFSCYHAFSETKTWIAAHSSASIGS